jgi:hypothetical protein
MNVEQTLLAISNPNDNKLTIAGIEAAKENWSVFYPELERLLEQFIADDTSLTDEQEAIVFFGTLLLAELKYSPSLSSCLQLFSRSDSYLTPVEAIFGDALTELTATLFFNVADGNTQALCDYIVDGHQAMYCKASAMEAVFAQYEVGVIDKTELAEQVTRWIAIFLALPSSINSFLMSALADYCIAYQFDEFKSQFADLCDINLFDEDRFKQCEIKAWDMTATRKLIESGIIQTDFNVVVTLKQWIDDDNHSEGGELDSTASEELDDLDSLMGKGGLFENILYDENTILENSVPVSSLATTGRNDACPCGSGKKYKKCCIR